MKTLWVLFVGVGIGANAGTIWAESPLWILLFGNPHTVGLQLFFFLVAGIGWMLLDTNTRERTETLY